MAETGPPFLRMEDVRVTYGPVNAVAGVTLDVKAHAFVALVGTSGSGKSTLLKTINRLADPDGGRVLLDGRDVAHTPAPALRRSIGYVFQGIGLFPHMSVAQNIGIGPNIEGRRIPRERVAQLLELVELDPALAGRMPDELSGGQRQRVGVARALANDPRLLLMDEPLGALDPVTRDALGNKLRRLHDDLGLTTIMVTHDMAEALLLADRVLVMETGRVVADCTPAQLVAGEGGETAQALVAVPRAQANALREMSL